MAKLWVDNTHPNYEIEAARRQFARDQFTGDALLVTQKEAQEMSDPAHEAGAPRELSDSMKLSRGQKRISLTYLDGSSIRPANGTYLRRRALGEAASAFRERAFITRFPSHMPALVEAYVGGVSAVESKWERTWGDPLGDPKDPSSVMFRMWHDIDGTGRNWRAANNKTLTDLIVDDVSWSFTELGSAGYPRTHMIDPQRIVDWHDEDGIPVWVLVEETKIVRDSYREPGEIATFYTEYDIEGWTRYRLIEGQNSEERDLQVVASEEWAFPFWSSPEKERKRLPFTRFRLSDIMGRYVGYQMAMDHNMLYNLLSDARWNFRVINNPRLVMRDAEASEDDFKSALALIGEGANALKGDWVYISPSHDNGMSAYKVYSEEVNQFYITNHQRFNRAAIERSATEIQFDEAAGRTSFLSIATDAIDEIENDRLFLASQIEAPERPETWLNARVQRSRDFKPIDIQNLAQTQANAFAAYANALSAEDSLILAKDGITEEDIERIRSRRQDIEVDVSQ